ncbi:MAG: DUF3800 domain-containing protein [Virgibacillus proomii]
MQDKEVYLLLTDTGTWLTRLIKLYTKKPFNHASIAFDEQLKQVYSFGRKTPKNPFIGGFVQEDIKGGIFKQATGVVYSISITEDQWKKMQNYIQQLQAEKDHYRYNFIGLFGFLLKRPIKRKNAFFCSQFVAAILQESNVIQFNKPISLISPYDLQTTESFQFVYEGKLQEFSSQTNDRLQVADYA